MNGGHMTKSLVRSYWDSQYTVIQFKIGELPDEGLPGDAALINVRRRTVKLTGIVLHNDKLHEELTRNLVEALGDFLVDGDSYIYTAEIVETNYVPYDVWLSKSSEIEDSEPLQRYPENNSHLVFLCGVFILTVVLLYVFMEMFGFFM